MTMALVKNGEVILDYIPSTYNNISNYHLLPEEYLLGKGWLPLEEILPEYDAETQQLINPSYEILTNKVIKSWELVEMSKGEVEVLKHENELLKQRLYATEMILLDLLLMGGM